MRRERLRWALLAAPLVSSCGQSGRPAEPPRDEAAGQVAAERAAEERVTDRAMLGRLSSEIAALQVEVDQMKASRQALNTEMIDARLQSLEVKAAAADAAVTPAVAPAPPAIGPAPAPTPGKAKAKPSRPLPPPVPALDGKDGKRKDGGR